MTGYAQKALVSGMRFLAESQAAIANNLANAETSSFKRRATIATEGSEFAGELDRRLPTVGVQEGIDWRLGNVRETGSQLDIALEQGSFLRVQDGGGRTYYTRNGKLQLDRDGFLVTQSGMRYLDAVPFLVAVSAHHNEVTERADVVFPAAVVAEKAGGFTDWEGRVRSFGPAIREASSIADGRILAMIADAMDVPFGAGDTASLRAELDSLTPAQGARAAAPSVAPSTAAATSSGYALLATWRLLLDRGRLQEGEPHLAATARPTEAVMSLATATSLGVANSATVTLSTTTGSVTLPLSIGDVADGAVWAPLNSEGCALLGIGATHGSVVRVTGGAA